MPSERKYIGPFARLSADAIRRADQMMLLATERIGADYAIEDIEDAPEGSTSAQEQILRAMEEATAAGRGDEFDLMLASMLEPMIDAVIKQVQSAPEGS